METQPGCVNWSGVNNMLDKGEARAMAWQGVAHGADAILYWQWRSAHGGQEQYHGTLVDQAGRPRPFYEEVAQLGKEFAMVSDLIAGSTPKATVAMLHSYESRWAIQWQRHHQDFDPVQHFLHFYRPLAARNIQVDILGADHLSKAEPFAGYRMVIAPSLNILHEGVVDALREYVKRGGHLVLTARCGMKDTYNAMLPLRQPGPLAEMAGVEVEDYYALLEPVPVKGNWFEGQTQIWAERLKPLEKRTTIALARYGKSNGWLDDQMAITANEFGDGLVYYVGAYLDDASQLALMAQILKTAACEPWLAPEGVEVSTRVKHTGEEIFFIINHKNMAQTISIPWPAIEYLSGNLLQGDLTLPPYGVTILTR
jgi:beta-galactosidase